MEREYNEKQNILLEYMGQLIYERDKDKDLLSDTEETRKWIEIHYERKIKLLREMLEEVK